MGLPRSCWWLASERSCVAGAHQEPRPPSCAKTGTCSRRLLLARRKDLKPAAVLSLMKYETERIDVSSLPKYRARASRPEWVTVLASPAGDISASSLASQARQAPILELDQACGSF